MTRLAPLLSLLLLWAVTEVATGLVQSGPVACDSAITLYEIPAGGAVSEEYVWGPLSPGEWRFSPTYGTPAPAPAALDFEVIGDDP